MATLKEQAQKNPWVTAAIMWLFAISCVLFPDRFFGGGAVAAMFASALVRLCFAGLGIFFMVRFGLAHALVLKLKGFRAADVLAVALVVAINNLPIVAFARGDVFVKADGLSFFAYGLQCLSVGLFEEVFFRGLIFMLVLSAFKPTKKGALAAIAVSSAAFGLTHLVNLLGGGSFPAVLAQIGYSAAVGAMLCVVLLFNGSVVFAALLHALYNFCGLLVDTLGGGNFWSPAQIALTAIVAVLAAGYLLLRFVRAKSFFLAPPPPAASADEHPPAA